MEHNSDEAHRMSYGARYVVGADGVQYRVGPSTIDEYEELQELSSPDRAIAQQRSAKLHQM